MSELLTFSRIGLLSHELRGKRRMVYSVGTSNSAFPVRVFSVMAGLHPSKFEDFTSIVHECIAKIADGMYPDHLLSAIFRRRQLAQMQESEFSRHGAIVDKLNAVWLRDYREDIDYLRLFEKTSREDISRVSKKYLQNVKWGSIIRLPK